MFDLSSFSLMLRPPRGRDDVITRLVLGGFWLTQIGLSIRCLGWAYAFLRHTGHIMWDVAGVLFVIAGVIRANAPDSKATSTSNLPLFAMLTVSAFATLVGLMYGNETYWLLIHGVIPFGTALLVFAGDTPELEERLFEAFVSFTYISLGLLLYAFIFARPADREIWYGLEGAGPAWTATQSFYFWPLMLPVLPRLRRMHKYAFSAAFVLHMTLHVVGYNRGPVIIQALAVPMLTLLLVQLAGKSQAISIGIFAPIALVTAMGTAVLPAIPSGERILVQLDDSAGVLMHRLSGENNLEAWAFDSVDTLMREVFGREGRGGELRDFLEQMHGVDWVIGRGFGGTWVSQFWGLSLEPHVGLHNGFADIVLVGGVSLLVTFLALCATATVKAFMALRHTPFSMGILLYFFTFFLNHSHTGGLSDQPDLYLFWLIVGKALCMQTPKRVTLTPVKPHFSGRRPGGFATHVA